ncbi:MAG: porin family protein [Sphingobium sp.]|nr:porin family protein [Sphingobium sp.]
MKTLMLIGAALVALSATPGMAKSAFEGPSVGVQAGWNHDIAINDKKDAVIGGVFAGYDHEVAPNIILGAEGGFSLGASDRIGPAGTNAATIDPNYSFDLSARAGYVVGEKNLLYVRGGYTNSRADVTRTVANVTTAGKQTFDGWFVGSGVERKLTDNVSARVEYRFNDIGSDNAKYQRHQALVGVAYRF